MTDIERFPSPESLALAAADAFIASARSAIDANGIFRVALSGGSTPRRMLAALAEPGRSAQVRWTHTRLYWGDERCVPPDNVDSNYRMTREALLDRAPIPPTNIHRIEGELNPTDAADRYDSLLHDTMGDNPRFDLIFLGMGDDGHTASLFPGTAALDEVNRRVVANYVPKFDAWRVTLTAPAINAAARIIFMVAGASKAHVLNDILHGPQQPAILPAQKIAPQNGQLIWMIDDAAARQLPE